jgi:magnesium and cobalt exporter, CNNM family
VVHTLSPGAAYGKLITDDTKQGIFDQTEQEFIRCVFDFVDTSAWEVLIPRIEVHALEVQTSGAEVLHAMIESGFSRMPMYTEDLEHIIGIVHIKELLRAQEHRSS